MPTLLSLPQGDLSLEITPPSANKSLQAWDAADEYLLQHLATIEPLATRSVVIVNDSYGALTNALADSKPSHMSDSWIARQAAIHNLALNSRDPQDISWLTSLEAPEKGIDVLLLKVPKSLALLEDQLIRLHPQLTENSMLIAAGMTRSIHTSTLKLFENILGPTHTSLARKKARLIFTNLDSQRATPPSPWPCRYELPEYQLTLRSHANVFSASKPDIGSRFMFDTIPTSDKKQTIIDLACGNGTLGIIAALQNPQADLVFTDESWMAIESAKLNFTAQFGDTRNAKFYVNDCLNDLKANSADLILNNPPFHQQNIITDEIASKMFQQAHSVLKKQGSIIVVGNRHLDYHNKLKRVFSNTKLLKNNRKFVILESIRH